MKVVHGTFGALPATYWPAWERAMRLVAVAILVAYGLLQALNVLSFGMEDAGAYWDAASRLTHGGPLYPAADPNAPDTFRYAPWFAWAWVPLTMLPRDPVMAVWGAVLVIASVACVVPMLRTRTPEGLALGILLGGFLLRAASTGNVQPLLLAGMIYGGPVGIALGASLKVAPIFALLGYRDWRKIALGLGLTAVLVAPMLLYDLSAYPTSGNGIGEMAFYWPLGLAGAYLALTNERYRWLGAAMAVMFLVPRLYPYTLSYLLVAIKRGTSPRD